MSAPPAATPTRAVLPSLTPAATAPAHRPPRFESKTSAAEGSFSGGVGPHQATKAAAPQCSSPPAIPKQRSIVSRIGAHVFFNRRPLDALIRKTKFSSSSSSINSPTATPPAMPPLSASSRQLTTKREDSSSLFWTPSRPDNTAANQPHAKGSRALKTSSVANTSAAASAPIVSAAASAPIVSAVASTLIVSAAAATSTVALQGGRPQFAAQSSNSQAGAAVRPPPHSLKDQEVSSASPATTASRKHPRAARLLAASSTVQSDSCASHFSVPTAEPAKAPSPAQILAKSRDDLTLFERREILDYPQVYFHAALAVKKRRRNGEVISELLASVAVDASAVTSETTDDSDDPMNSGFDDSRGDYLVVPHDHLAYRYEVLYELGSGSFGQVVCCLDHQTQQKVAVKIIRNRSKYREQSFIEVQLLSTLWERNSTHQSQQDQQQRAPIVRMFDYFEFRNHLCITFELLGVNLYDILKVRYFQGLPLANIRLIAQQLLQALAFLREQDVIHCDLKPENVLVQAPGCYFTGEPVTTAQANIWIDKVKLVDFGSSCLASKAVFTYIQSRFYRSPEVMLGHAYDCSIDMWSFACILVELYTGHPLFAGENEADQMGCIMELLGVPSDAFLSRCRRWKNFFEEENQAPSEASEAPKSPRRFRPRPIVSSRGWKRVPGARQLATVMKCDDVKFLAFLQKCLEWDPAQRLTPEQALQDPWILAVSGSSAS